MNNMELEFDKNIADDLSILSPSRDFDDSIGEKVLQVMHGEEWIEVTEMVFRSWTGHRRINGEDHHGPVYNFGKVENLKPYSGSRSCGCSVCQAHVQPRLKKN
jgi:hypothetical protein